MVSFASTLSMRWPMLPMMEFLCLVRFNPKQPSWWQLQDLKCRSSCTWHLQQQWEVVCGIMHLYRHFFSVGQSKLDLIQMPLWDLMAFSSHSHSTILAARLRECLTVGFCQTGRPRLGSSVHDLVYVTASWIRNYCFYYIFLLTYCLLPNRIIIIVMNITINHISYPHVTWTHIVTLHLLNRKRVRVLGWKKTHMLPMDELNCNHFRSFLGLVEASDCGKILWSLPIQWPIYKRLRRPQRTS